MKVARLVVEQLVVLKAVIWQDVISRPKDRAAAPQHQEPILVPAVGKFQ
jgi:hypothetical protein